MCVCVIYVEILLFVYNLFVAPLRVLVELNCTARTDPDLFFFPEKVAPEDRKRVRFTIYSCVGRVLFSCLCPPVCMSVCLFVLCLCIGHWPESLLLPGRGCARGGVHMYKHMFMSHCTRYVVFLHICDVRGAVLLLLWFSWSLCTLACRDLVFIHSVTIV